MKQDSEPIEDATARVPARGARPDRARPPRPLAFAWAALLFALAVAIRLLPWRYVVMSDRIQFFGYDAYYHMRRIVYSLAHFPATLEFDRYMNFPEGARAIWTPLFDWGIAALLWLSFESATVRQVSVLASLVPPVLGGATVLAVAALARRHFGDAAGVLAGLVLALLPGHYWYSQVGYVDQHCAIALVTTLLLSAGMRAFETLPSQHGRDPRAWRSRRVLGSSLLLGGWMALALLVWPGSLLHMGIIEIALLCRLLSQNSPGEACLRARDLVAIHAAALCVVAPWSLGQQWAQWSDMSPVVLSNFQPWYFASATLFGLSCATAWSWVPALGSTPLRRGTSAFAIGVSIVGGSLLLWPQLLTGMSEAWAWISKTDSFQALVGESDPLLMRNGEITFSAAVPSLSGFFFLVPVALVAGLASARARVAAAPVLLLLFWCGIVCAMAVVQTRFMNSASIAVALLLALSSVAAARALRRRIPAGGRQRAAVAALGVACAGLVAPAWAVYAPLVTGLGQRGQQVVISGSRYDSYALSEVAMWIRENTPPTVGWLDGNEQPEYGIVAPWHMGHILTYVARRPTSTNNFGDDIGARQFLAVQEYFVSDEARGSALLDQLQGRYVVVPSYTSFLGEGVRPDAESMYRALYRRDGSEKDGSTGTGIGSTATGRGVPALQRHRLIYEYGGMSSGPVRRASHKVFEYVSGARIRGRAPAEAELRLSLGIETSNGRRFVYRARTQASPNGSYEFRVPYSNEIVAKAIAPDDRYVIEIAGASGEAHVREIDVVRGGSVRGPTLPRTQSHGADRTTTPRSRRMSE